MGVNGKRGQVTLFIIIGIIIVVMGVLIFLFYPQIKSSISSNVQTPESFIQNCLEEEISNNVKIISLQGGSLGPQGYYLYENYKISYLCYTNEDLKKCVVQKAPLKMYIEDEIKNSIEKNVEQCFSSLKESYEKSGYDVTIKKGDYKVELLPKRVVTTLNYSVTLAKQDTVKYENFNVIVNNNVYELMTIANSIVEWERNYGDSETTLYMALYKDLKVEKKKQSEGSTIYIITDRNNENKFQFAVRSIALPVGY